MMTAKALIEILDEESRSSNEQASRFRRKDLVVTAGGTSGSCSSCQDFSRLFGICCRISARGAKAFRILD